jgi:hypothetical protein
VALAVKDEDREGIGMRLARRALVVVLLAAATTMIAVGRPAPPGRDTQRAHLNSARFTTRIDNPFWPLRRWAYPLTGWP